MPETWRCECGYTNMNAKACIVCRRPRQAVTSATASDPPAEVIDPEPASELVTGPPAEDQRPKRPLRTGKAAKRTTRRTPKD